MTRAATLVTFGRAGGRPPADDEWVKIASDGTFEARRTLGGRRIGRFAGTLTAATLKALELEASDDGARLVHAGSETLELDPRSVAIRVTRLDAESVPTGSWSGTLGMAPRGAPGPIEWTTAGPGWTLDVPLGPRSPEDTAGVVRTQILVTLRIREGGSIRDARLIGVTGEWPSR